MKKILSTFILINFITAGFLIVGGVTLAAEGPLEGCTIDNVERLGGLDCELTEGVCIFGDGDCPTCCILNSLYNVTDVIFFILLGIATIYVILGAMNLLMSAGDPSKVASGRNHIVYAMIGLLFAFLARAIPAIVKSIVGA